MIRNLSRLLALGMAGFVTAAAGGIGVTGTVIDTTDEVPKVMPVSPKCTDLEAYKYVPCPDSQLFFHEGSALVQRAFGAGDFAALEGLFTRWSTGKDRFPDGRWKLSQYGDALYQWYQAYKLWPGDMQKIKRWQETYPKSFAAQYAEAIYWRAYAWQARGGGYARTVAPEAWELFAERLKKAQTILDQLAAGAERNPAWYPAKINNLLDLGRPDDEARKIFDEGIRRFPEYQNIYFTMARAYDPLWGGSAEEYQAFANEAVKLAEGFEGPAMYARLYWLVDSHDSLPFLPPRTRYPDWNKLKTGFDELMRRYPASLHNLNQYASVACRSDNGALYRRLRTALGIYADEDVFSMTTLDACDHRHQWVSPSKPTVNSIEPK